MTNAFMTALIGNDDYPVTPELLEVFRGGVEQIVVWHAEHIGQLNWDGEARWTNRNISNADVWANPETGEPDWYANSHRGLREVGVDPWGENQTWLVLGLGYGGVAMGVTLYHPDGSYRLGMCITGCWGFKGEGGFVPYDVETLDRLGWPATSEPARWGDDCHEVLHGMSVGPHTTEPGNIMNASGYLIFPESTITPAQIASVRACDLHTGEISVPDPTPDPEPEEPPRVAMLRIRPKDEYRLRRGHTRKFKVEATYNSGLVVNVTSLAEYQSSDPDVADVTTTGRIYAEGPGSAAILVSFGGHDISVAVTVR